MIYNDLVDIIYPVGSIYLSYNNTNPGTIFEGTTWVSYGTSSQYLRLGGNGTGGSSTSGSTTLTVNQIPSHNHSISGGSHSHLQERFSGLYCTHYTSTYNHDAAGLVWNAGGATGNSTPSYTIGNKGGGQGHTHSINPEYIQVYAWKRTA